ncbi:MAG: universal stress protein [Cyanobacteria bacterium P01_A01_bin.114]
MFKRALICTDFEDGLQRLVHFVPGLATGGLEQIVFFHNVPLTPEREIPKVDAEEVEAARQRLAVAQQSAPEGTTVKVEVQSGRAIDNILKSAKTNDSDIIFLGMPTRTLLTEKLFGSTTVGITKQTMSPLMILRPQLVATYRESELMLRMQHLFEYLLLPYDGSSSAQYLVNQIKHQVSSTSNCKLKHCLLCWVIDDSVRKELRGAHQVNQAESELAKVKSELEELGISVNTEVRQGDPKGEILKSAEVNDITAIAVCSGKSNMLARFSVPSFTNMLLRCSWHPILHFPRES